MKIQIDEFPLFWLIFLASIPKKIEISYYYLLMFSWQDWFNFTFKCLYWMFLIENVNYTRFIIHSHSVMHLIRSAFFYYTLFADFIFIFCCLLYLWINSFYFTYVTLFIYINESIMLTNFDERRNALLEVRS